jgi:hypothetical protein
MAGCAIALSLATGTALAADGQLKFKATRDIAIDQATGKPRKPTAAVVATLVADLRQMTRRPLAAQASVRKDGARSIRLDGGEGGVMLARPRSDGTFELRCVFSFDEAIQFLGLVADNAQ